MIQKFKIIDLIGQVLCFVVPFVFLFIHGLFSVILYIYMAVGAWQVLSYIANRFLIEQDHKVALRRKYGNVLGVVTAIVLVSLLLLLFQIPHLIILTMVASLFITPFILVFYLVVTIEELHLATMYIKRNEFVQKR